MHCITRYIVYDFLYSYLKRNLSLKKERKGMGVLKLFYLVIDRSNFLLFICLYCNLVPDLF